MMVEGEYVSVWDGGREVISAVSIDPDRMRIIEWKERWLGGNADGDDNPDEFENLEEEYVYIPGTGTTYTASNEAESDWVEDIYGNGIIVY